LSFYPECRWNQDSSGLPRVSRYHSRVRPVLTSSAYGKLIGTFLVCSFLEMGMSFVPAKKLRKIFPPLVTGLTVVLIGASLVGKSGFLNWGGGTNDCQLRPAAPSIFRLCPTINAPNALP
jgi:xanthine/uracil permease